ncbi:MAG: ATP-binding protein, partial [Planctomycetota bacterium]
MYGSSQQQTIKDRLVAKLKVVVDWFMPSSIRCNDTDAYRRARTVVAFTIALIILAHFYASLLFWMGSTIGAVAIVAAIMVGIFILFLIRETGSSLLTGNLLAANFFAVLTVLAWRLGGHGALTLPWYAGVPVVAISTAGKRSSFIWMFITVVSLGIFYGLDYNQYTFHNDLTVSDYKLLYLLATIGLVVLILTFVFLYETFKDKTQGQLWRERRFAECIINSSFDGILAFDRDCRYTVWNAGMERISGMTKAEVIGRCAFDVFTFLSETGEDKLFFDALAGKSVFSGDRRYIVPETGQGGFFEGYYSPLRDESGEIVGGLAIIRDITERKQAEEDKEHFLQDMQGWVKELDCMYGVANSLRRCERLEDVFQEVVGLITSGWQYSDIARAKIRFGNSEYVSEPFEETAWKLSSEMAIDSEPCGEVEVYYLEERPDLDEGPFLSEERKLIDGIAHALSEAVGHKRTEAELQRAKESAEAANQSKSEKILCCDECPVHTSCPQRSEGGKKIQTIRQSCEYLLHMINTILDMSKIEAGNLEVERIPCSPFELMADIQLLMRARAESKGLSFDIEYIGAIPETIQTDPLRLRQILINLSTNAIKFTRDGGVCLFLRFIDGGTVTNSMMQFDVVDTGVGMTEEQIAVLFQPFVQADSSTSGHFSGIGLGLAISKRLAELLGGDVFLLDSKAGRGTRIRVTIRTGRTDGVRFLESP